MPSYYDLATRKSSTEAVLRLHRSMDCSAKGVPTAAASPKGKWMAWALHQADRFDPLVESSNKKNFWHGRQILQIAQTIGMELLYKTAYKTASGITHGSSYPILSRNEKLEWVIRFQKHQWDRCVKDSPVFGYLMLGHFCTEVFRLFQIADTTNFNEMADVCLNLASSRLISASYFARSRDCTCSGTTFQQPGQKCFSLLPQLEVRNHLQKPQAFLRSVRQ